MGKCESGDKKYRLIEYIGKIPVNPRQEEVKIVFFGEATSRKYIQNVAVPAFSCNLFRPYVNPYDAGEHRLRYNALG